jgi:antagonist of KipI
LGNNIQVIEGPEFELLNEDSKKMIKESKFVISTNSNRMGYRMQGAALVLKEISECLSSAVSMGTLQLLPDGNTILLMADHQTTGGYHRLAHVSSAAIPSLAQMYAGDSLSYLFISLDEAEKSLQSQQKHLKLLKNACNFRLQEYLSND